MEHRYTSSNENIARIQNALRSCAMGRGFAELFTVTVEKVDKHSSTLVFTSDREKPLNPMEFFEFGIIIGREYFPKVEH